jgi:Glycosyltransferase family 87
VSLQRVLASGLIVAVVAGFSVYVAVHPMDFRVYHYGARGVFDGTRPVYGTASGLGWPMHYRYPPLFLLLFAPFAWLPLGPSAALWMILKALVLCLLVSAVYEGFKDRRYLIPVLLAGPYVIEDFRYGNAQFFVFALAAACLLLVRKRPVIAATALALGIAIKVWPLFFVPYLAVRRQTRAAVYTLLIAVILLLLPSVYFGFGGNLNLLAQWFHQEFTVQTGQDEIWFPSQSLRGVMMRYLTAIDYSQVPDSNYPHVNLANWTPSSVRGVWMTLSVAIYGAFLWIAFSRRQNEGWIESALGFCLLALLEPFTQKYALVILLWPAIVAGRIVDESPVRYLVYAAIAFALVQPVMPGAATQRLLQALGFDFAATALLALAFITYSLFRYESLIYE